MNATMALECNPALINDPVKPNDGSNSVEERLRLRFLHAVATVERLSQDPSSDKLSPNPLRRNILNFPS
jgi:hypothetical protein